MFIMFVTKYDSSEEISLEDMMKSVNPDPNLYLRAYRNEYYKKAAKLWLPFLDERGFLDSLLPSLESTENKSSN